MFSIIFLFNPAETTSNSTTAALLSFHPTEPIFSSACTRFLAPGIGTVPLLTAQFIATCNGVLFASLATAFNVARRGQALGNSSRKSCRQGLPGRGRLSRSYFPLNRPKQRGEYETKRHPASLQASSLSLFREVIREYWTSNIDNGVRMKRQHVDWGWQCQWP